MDLTVHNGETERQYIWRLHKYVENGELSWKTLADCVNRNFRDSEEEYRDESAYRKPVQSASAYYDEVFSKFVDDEYCKEIAVQKRELEKAKVRFRDERNEYNRENRVAARVEQKLDYLQDMLEEQGKVSFPVPKITVRGGNKSMIVSLADLHIGQSFSSVFGKYDSNIAKERLGLYLEKIKEYAKLHNVSDCYVAVLGDDISGAIHKSIAITNRENVIEQIKLASEYISSFCAELCEVFNSVSFYNVSGNHSRISRKEDALHSERLDDLIGWNVEHFLAHIPNFKVEKSCNWDNGIASMWIKNCEYVLVHGDFDSHSKQGIANLSFMLGRIPYGVLMGHRHYSAFTDESGVKIIQSGSLAGSGDDHTIERRLKGNASQTICICDSTGELECLYPVDLSKTY